MQEHMDFVIAAYGFAAALLGALALQSAWRWKKYKKHL